MAFRCDLTLTATDADTAFPLPRQFRNKVSAGQQVTFGFRADTLMPQGHALAESGEMAELALRITLAEPLGAETMLLSDIAGVEVQGKMLNPRPVSEGEVLTCQLALDQCHLFDAHGKSLR